MPRKRRGRVPTGVDVRRLTEATIQMWADALDLRTHETEGHTRRVTALTLRLPGVMGMRDGNLIHISRGALLHDIGRLGLPDSLLLKRGAFTNEEWALMRTHPVLAYELLSPVIEAPALDIPHFHHEKWDGR
jgi:HD-GYP domain-containing protein (c-di-GMP phosphodiesterase class II)